MNAYEELIEVALIKDFKNINKETIQKMFEEKNSSKKIDSSKFYTSLYENRLKLKPEWILGSKFGVKPDYLSLYLEDFQDFYFSNNYTMLFEEYPENIWKIAIQKKFIDRNFYNSSTKIGYNEDTFQKYEKMSKFLNTIKSKAMNLSKVGSIIYNEKKSNNIFYQEDIVCEYEFKLGKINRKCFYTDDGKDEMFLNFLEEKFSEFYPEKIFDKSFFELNENEIEILTGYYI